MSGDINLHLLKENRYASRKPGTKKGALGWSVAVSVTVRQALLDINEISSGIDFNGLEVETPIVNIRGYKTEKLTCNTEVQRIINFGIATFNTRHTGGIPFENVRDYEALPICIDIPFRKKRHGQASGPLVHAIAINTLEDWARDILSGVVWKNGEAHGKPLIKTSNFENPVYLQKKSSGARIPVGTVYYQVSISLFKNLAAGQIESYDPVHDASLRCALTGPNAENVARHI